MRCGALALVAFLFAVNVYRAATQSITLDEAFTYNHYAGGDVPLKVYDANNHVLYTMLAKLSVAVLGLSEFTLRLPALLGGLLYLGAVYRLSRWLFGETWLFLLSVGALSLNPLVLDFLSAARGYGLALALFMWALYLVAQEAGNWHWAGFLLGLAVSASLTLAFPCAAAAAVFAIMRAGGGLRRLVWRFCLPAALPAAAILAWPLRTATRENFYYGAETLRKTLASLADSSFIHSQPGAAPWLAYQLWDASQWLVPAVFVAVAGLCLKMARRRDREPADQMVLLGGVTMLVTLALVVAAHYAIDLKYPLGRTGLYWIPLFTLVALALTGALRRSRVMFLLAGLPLVVFFGLSIARYALQFNTSCYTDWRYDAGTKRVVDQLRARQAAQPKASVGLGATWRLEPSLNFYRQKYRLGWLQNISREGPAGVYDYYVLEGDDTRLVEELGLAVVYRDAVSEAVLAVPGAG